MSTRDTGGNAFPTGDWEYDRENNIVSFQQRGMTLRDYFAGQAITSIMSNDWYGDSDARRIARLAYELADEMLYERLQ